MGNANKHSTSLQNTKPSLKHTKQTLCSIKDNSEHKKAPGDRKNIRTSMHLTSSWPIFVLQGLLKLQKCNNIGDLHKIQHFSLSSFHQVHFIDAKAQDNLLKLQQAPLSSSTCFPYSVFGNFHLNVFKSGF